MGPIEPDTTSVEADLDVQAVVAKHRSLLILRLLAGPLNGAGNEAVLAELLDLWALGGTRDALRACIASLERSDLVATTMAGECTVVRLTPQGDVVATGKARVPGVLPFTVGCPY
jgi:hypothetical protein